MKRLFLIAIGVIFFLTSGFAPAGEKVTLGGIRAVCTGSDLSWQLKVTSAPRNPQKVTLFVAYMEYPNQLGYSKLTGQTWSIWVSNQQTWYEGVTPGGCLAPAWAYNQKVTFKLVAKYQNQKVSSGWMKPKGYFYPDNPAKFIPPPGYFQEWGYKEKFYPRKWWEKWTGGYQFIY